MGFSGPWLSGRFKRICRVIFCGDMSGITEVNPLPAHYICPECYYVDFDSPEVKKYARMGMSGCDMPDAVCPKCGAKLNKEGHDIPFETFLDLKGTRNLILTLIFQGNIKVRPTHMWK